MQFGPETTVRNFFRMVYVPECLPGGAHAKSRAEYEQQIAKLNEFYAAWCAAEGLPLREVQLGDLCDALLKLAMQWWCEEGHFTAEDSPRGRRTYRGNSPGTANKLYRHVKAIWNLAWASDVVALKCRTRPYREVRRKARAWTPEQIEQIVRAALLMPGSVGPTPAGDWWLAHILTAMSLGVRISAQMSILAVGFNDSYTQVWIDGETQKHRADQAFDLLPGATQALRRLAPRERGLQFAFGDWPYDPGRSWNILRKHLRRLLVSAGLFARASDVGRVDLFHKFRKSVATQIAIRRGVEAARLFLGHSTTRVTEGYVDAMQVERPRATEVLIDPFPPSRQLRMFSGG